MTNQMKTFLISHEHEKLIGGIVPFVTYADTEVKGNNEDEVREKFLSEWKSKETADNSDYQDKGLTIRSIEELI